MIPGILALVLLVVTTTLSSMAIVREKEVGTLEQLNVTPIARWELIVGKLVPYAALGMVDVLLVVAVAVRWFEVPLRGSFALLLLMCLVYLLTALGLGLFVSTVSRTQQQAMMTTAFFFLVPMIFLSGFVFPDREHARPRSAGHLSHSTAVLSRHSAWNLSQGSGAGRALAGCAGAVRMGRRDSDSCHPSIDETAGVNDACRSRFICSRVSVRVQFGT